jgi:hypothetical protein
LDYLVSCNDGTGNMDWEGKETISCQITNRKMKKRWEAKPSPVNSTEETQSMASSAQVDGRREGYQQNDICLYSFAVLTE